MWLDGADREVNHQALSSNETCSSAVFLLPAQHTVELSKTRALINKSKIAPQLSSAAKEHSGRIRDSAVLPFFNLYTDTKVVCWLKF